MYPYAYRLGQKSVPGLYAYMFYHDFACQSRMSLLLYLILKDRNGVSYLKCFDIRTRMDGWYYYRLMYKKDKNSIYNSSAYVCWVCHYNCVEFPYFPTQSTHPGNST